MSILAWGLGLGSLVAATVLSFGALVPTPEAQASLRELSRSFAWYAEPFDRLTPGAFTTWRLGPLLAILPAVWALLVGSGTLRGEEERGSLDVLLSVPRSRLRVASEKVAAVFTATLLLGALASVPIATAGLRAGDYGPTDAALFGLNVALHAAAYAGLALLVSQFTRERGAAAGVAGALLAAAFALDATGRTADLPEGVRTVSTLYLYHLSRPLAGAGANAGGMAALAGIAVLTAAVAVGLFARRDIGASIPLLPARRSSRPAPRARALPSRDWSVRSPFLRSLRVAGGAGLWWALGVAVYAAWMAGIAQQTRAAFQRLFESSPLLASGTGRLSGGGLASGEGLLSLIVFSFLPLLVSAYAVTQAGGWRADEDEGRLELLLASPQPRWRVLLWRFLALAVVVSGMALLVLAALWLVAQMSDMAVDGGRLVGATLGMVPLALAVGALGYALAGWLRPSTVAGLLALVVVGSLLLSFLGPLLDLPSALVRLSLLEQYGTPLVSGVDWGGLARLTALAAAALAVGTYRFATKDLAR